MKRPQGGRTLAVVLASIDAATTVRESLDRWLGALGGRGDLIVVDSSRDATAETVAAHFPEVRLLRRPPGCLAPELWRDGLDATGAAVVAFSTVQMVPAENWLDVMLEGLDATGAAAVGGPILPPEAAAGARARAWYLLRYVGYLRPLVAPERLEPPGDNAVYRRDRLDGLEAFWANGFWEVDIHRALRARGERLAMAEGAVRLLGTGTGPFGRLIGQRHAHARQYGASRARHLGRGARWARIAAVPIVPVVLLRRITAALRTRHEPLYPWLPALPYLLPLLAAWALGEARGLAGGVPGKRHTGQMAAPGEMRIAQVLKPKKSRFI
jgi:hypothetical protein